jgi:hypothetical protein
MKKSFDAVAFMRKRREELSQEYSGLSFDEIVRRNHEALKDDPLWLRLKERVVVPAPQAAAVVREPSRKYGKARDR